MSFLLEMIGRGWENLLARPNGSLSLRFYVQPTMASLLALRAGIQDARQGRQGYLWAILTRPERRLQLLHEGWRGAMTPFLLALVLDCIYQIMTIRFVYPLNSCSRRPCSLWSRTPYCGDRSIASPGCSCQLLDRRRR